MLVMNKPSEYLVQQWVNTQEPYVSLDWNKKNVLRKILLQGQYLLADIIAQHWKKNEIPFIDIRCKTTGWKREFNLINKKEK